MSEVLKKKIDFAVIISVEHANPNGDPLNGNRPRVTYDRLGEISDVCLKRKIRNRLLGMGESIFVQSDDNRVDKCRSLKERYDQSGISAGNEREETCKQWFDVRAFGQVFAFGGSAKKERGKKASEKNTDNTPEQEDGKAFSVSIGIRGPVTIQSAYSLDSITTDSIQITKSVNLETESNPDKKAGDTMGMKHRVTKGVYVAYGAINTQLATRTQFTDEDAQKIKDALRSLFVNDVSSARPEGSMSVLKVVWWQHDSSCGQYSSAKVHSSLKKLLDITKDGSFEEEALKAALPGLQPEILGELEGDALEECSHRCRDK